MNRESRTRSGPIDWTELLASHDINVINDILVENLSNIYDTEAPLKKIQVRKTFRSWVTDDIKNKMRDRDRKRELAIQTGDREDWKNYRNARNRVTKDLRKCKKLSLQWDLQQAGGGKRHKKAVQCHQKFDGMATGFRSKMFPQRRFTAVKTSPAGSSPD